MILDKNTNAFNLLAKKINENNLTCRIFVYNGGAMIQLGGTRIRSKDIDYRVLNLKRLTTKCDLEETEIQTLRRIIHEVAIELDLDDDWINDGVKGFISKNEDFSEETSYNDGSLSIIDPSLEYLLAMKCVSIRNENDSLYERNDIKKILNILNISNREDVFKIVDQYYPIKQISSKTMFDIEEIFEEIRNSTSASC